MAKKTFPTFVPPMMANSVKEPFDSPDWIFEVKLDGYRGIAVFDAAGKPHLWSRNGLPLEQKFPAVATALSKLKLRSTILDGEVVAVDENGIPRFQLLQRFQKQPTAPTLYYIFDILWSEGEDITAKPIMERTIKPTAGIQVGSYVEGEGKALFDLTKEKGMEGIIAKRKDNIVANREIPLRWNWNIVNPAQLFFSGSSTITAAHCQRGQRFGRFSRCLSSFLTFLISWASSFSDGKTVLYSLARTLLARPSSA
jgi:ATP-dependent DNA ligase